MTGTKNVTSVILNGERVGHVAQFKFSGTWMAVGYVYFDAAKPEVGIERLPEIGGRHATKRDAMEAVRLWRLAEDYDRKQAATA